jgi:hypothetical protein
MPGIGVGGSGGGISAMDAVVESRVQAERAGRGNLAKMTKNECAGSSLVRATRSQLVWAVGTCSVMCVLHSTLWAYTIVREVGGNLQINLVNEYG